MKFLCDVHIPYKLSKYLTKKGFESIHIDSILNKWHTDDLEISTYADKNDFILITKDADFRESHFLKVSPKKLIRICLGNMSNDQLIDTFEQNFEELSKFINNPKFYIEINSKSIFVIEE